MTDVEKPTLIYFNVIARAEVPRLLLELAGVDYIWRPIAYNGSSGESWEEYKKEHSAELTFGQIPQYKEPGGVNIVQTASIIRYLGKKHGFNGSNEKEALAIDSLFEGVLDLFVGVIKVKFADPSKQAAELESFTNEFAPKILAHFQRALESNHGGQGYLVGDKLSYADVELFVGLLFVSKLTGDAVVPKFPALAKYYERISNLPAVKKYYSSDPYA